MEILVAKPVKKHKIEPKKLTKKASQEVRRRHSKGHAAAEEKAFKRNGAAQSGNNRIWPPRGW
jgi:hypothetical protein